MKFKLLVIYIVCFLGFLSACKDTDLENLSNPNAADVLATSEDYVKVLDGAVLAFWNGLHKYEPYMTLSVAADHGSSSWGNFGMREVGTVGNPYGLGDHSPINNSVTANYTGFLETPYEQLYASLSSANDVLGRLNEDDKLSEENLNQLKAYALYVRGVAYGYLALLYDRALIVTEDSDLTDQEFENFSTYDLVSEQALSDLMEAIAIAEATSSISITGFNGLIIDKETLISLSYSYAAKFLIQTPRTKAESDAVDWASVEKYADLGLKGGFDLSPIGDGGTTWWHAFYLHHNSGWLRLDQKVVNMVNAASPYPYPEAGYPSDEADLAAMDARFDGSKFAYAGSAPFRPDRGVYFFSYWVFNEYSGYRGNLTDPMPSFEARENLLNLAEALIKQGKPGAAAIINETRVDVGGLAPATDGDVDLLDKLMYERYLEVYEGPGNPFFDRRRTDDLGSKQFKDLPVPAKEINAWEADIYTTGGI